MKSVEKMSQAELAAYVHEHLRNSGLYVVLSGGAAVGIYSDGEYVSGDIDFVNAGFASRNTIKKSMGDLGFIPKGRHFEHPKSDHIVEFPPGPLHFGDGSVKNVSELVFDRAVASMPAHEKLPAIENRSALHSVLPRYARQNLPQGVTST
jgi:hypothetical protein